MLSWSDFSLSFLALVFEGLPFLFYGAVLSAAVEVCTPALWWRRFNQQSVVSMVLLGMAAGFVLPLCECGAVMVTWRLIRRGLARPMAVGYLLASPLLNPLCLFTTYLAFQKQDPWLMVGLRFGLGAILVFWLAWWIARQTQEGVWQDSVEGIGVPRLLQVDAGQASEAADCGCASPPTWCCLREHAPSPRFQGFVLQVMRDFMDILPFFLIGVGVAAFLTTQFHQAWLQPILRSSFWAPLGAIGLAQGLCLCSSTDAFVIAAFPTLAIPAKIAFLIAGPLFDFKLFWLYQLLFTRRLVLQLWWRVTAGALVLTWLLGLKP